ncbi:MAG: sugar porter family MFS transporter [Solirubrobacteraceae bacterium]
MSSSSVRRPAGSASSEQDSPGSSQIARTVGRITVIAALGGFLFGYDTGVISGALLYITAQFHLGSFGQQAVVASLLLGAVCGALIGGAVSDRLGRKRTLLAAAAVFALGALASAVSPSAVALVISRFVIGLALGTSSMAVPTYLAEMSPKEKRGRLVSMNQFLITVGILCAYGVGYAFSSSHDWRWMLGLAAVPALLMFVGLLTLPESPRWLFAAGRDDDAHDVLKQTRPAEEIDDEAAEIKETIEAESGSSFRDLLKPNLRPALRVGVGVPAINQLVGVNAVIYYTPTILHQTGFGASASILGSVGVGTMNVLLTLTALLVIDRVGRRPLVLIGVGVLTVALAVLGALYLLPSQHGTVGVLIVIGLCVYISAFAASLGIAIWLFTSEVYPNEVRGKGSSVGVLTHWSLDFVISLTVLTLISTITTTGMFWLYGAFALGGFFYLRRFLPETKGRSLEEIDQELQEEAAVG